MSMIKVSEEDLLHINKVVLDTLNVYYNLFDAHELFDESIPHIHRKEPIDNNIKPLGWISNRKNTFSIEIICDENFAGEGYNLLWARVSSHVKNLEYVYYGNQGYKIDFFITFIHPHVKFLCPKSLSFYYSSLALINVDNLKAVILLYSPYTLTTIKYGYYILNIKHHIDSLSNYNINIFNNYVKPYIRDNPYGLPYLTHIYDDNLKYIRTIYDNYGIKSEPYERVIEWVNKTNPELDFFGNILNDEDYLNYYMKFGER